MKIYITRHGQTDWNAMRHIQGRTDIPLNEEGRKQAAIVRDGMKDIELDAIISSPLIRAQETADIINEEHKLPILQDERVIERAFGDLEGTDIKEMNFTNFWHPERTQLYPTCEKVQDFYHRIYNFIDEVKATYKGKNILVVAHGGVSLPFYSYFNGVPNTEDMRQFMLNNCEVVCYTIEDDN